MRLLIGSVLTILASCLAVVYFLYKCGQPSFALCKIWTYVRPWFDTFPAVVQTKTAPWVTATLATICTMKTFTITFHECTKKQCRVAARGMLVSYLLWQYKIHTFPAMYMICQWLKSHAFTCFDIVTLFQLQHLVCMWHHTTNFAVRSKMQCCYFGAQ